MPATVPGRRSGNTDSSHAGLSDIFRKPKRDALTHLDGKTELSEGLSALFACARADAKRALSRAAARSAASSSKASVFANSRRGGGGCGVPLSKSSGCGSGQEDYHEDDCINDGHSEELPEPFDFFCYALGLSRRVRGSMPVSHTCVEDGLLAGFREDANPFDTEDTEKLQIKSCSDAAASDASSGEDSLAGLEDAAWSELFHPPI